MQETSAGIPRFVSQRDFPETISWFFSVLKTSPVQKFKQGE